MQVLVCSVNCAVPIKGSCLWKSNELSNSAGEFHIIFARQFGVRLFEGSTRTCRRGMIEGNEPRKKSGINLAGSHSSSLSHHGFKGAWHEF